MDDKNKATRKQIYLALNFLGSADWAVDLQDNTSDDSNPGSGAGETIYINPDIWASAMPVVSGPPGATLGWPPMPLTSMTTISFDPWTTTISYSSLDTLTSTLSDGTTSTYLWYVYVSWLTILNIPPLITSAIPVWGVTLDPKSTCGPIVLTSPIQPSPFTINLYPVISGTTSIIGATETMTKSGGIVVWGSVTYVELPETETLGGTTSVVGGRTVNPVVVTVTPNPHPTVVPSTTDPRLNSKKPSWTSGKPGPTSNPGCDGCGSPCKLFCDPDCPFCPPNVFGSNDGGSNDDDEHRSTTTPSNTMATYTFDYAIGAGDEFPTDFAAVADLSSLFSAELTLISSFFSLNPSLTTTLTTPPVVMTPTPTPTATADCAFWDEFWFYTFEVYNIAYWAYDGGDALHTQENGCGALTGWDWHPPSEYDEYVYFNLPFTISAGCVERAIASAGGPQLSCAGQGFGTRDASSSPGARSRMRAVPPSYSMEQKTYFEGVYGSNKTYVAYQPMDWLASGSSATPSR